jgi:hypothetical protein
MVEPSMLQASPAALTPGETGVSAGPFEVLETRAPWSPGKRFLFRFVFSYFALYLFPFPLDLVPWPIPGLELYGGFWRSFVPRLGKQLFHLEITVFPNGSGDTTFNYLQILCYLALALAATLVWTLLDRRRLEYTRLHQWFRIYLRFSLAATMLSYGGIKVIKGQFPNPSLSRLVQPFGDASPMGLLWTFMGASKAYTNFSGACEMLGGFLLTARRTTLLGALVCMGVITNIVLLNLCYDVPVKLFSTHLLVISLLLIAPDARRLADLFLFNRQAGPPKIGAIFNRPWIHRSAIALRTLLLVAYTIFVLQSAYKGAKTYGDLAPKPPFYGIWNVEELVVDGQVRPPLVTDASRWRRAIFDFPGAFSIQLMNDSRQRFNLKQDAKQKIFEISKREDPKAKTKLTYQEPGPGLLSLEGTLDGRKISAKLRRADASSYLLMNRGFHWINEYPFNR